MPIIKHSANIIALSFLTITILLVGTASAQNQIKNNNGITITEKDDITVYLDEFTGKYAIAVTDSSNSSGLKKNPEERFNSYIIPFYGGDIYDSDLTKLTWTEKWSDDLILVLIREEPEQYFFEGKGNKEIPFLIDEKRLSKSASYLKKSSSEIIKIIFTFYEWEKITNSVSAQFRINGQVFTLDENTKHLMKKILGEHQRIQIEEVNEELSAIKSLFQEIDNTLFTEDNEELKDNSSAPYSLKWEGDIQRSPVVQPLPSNTQGVEAVITIRFQVRPDGSIGRIIPLKKMNPKLEHQILTSLRRWKFSELPSGVPQQAQWGTITFRFFKE